MKLEVKKDRIEINNQRKKDDEVTLATEIIHPEPRNNTEEDNRKSVKTDVVDNHVDTDNLRNPVLDAVTPLDGCRTNPQDDPGQTSGVANGDTDDSIFPADSKSYPNKSSGYVKSVQLNPVSNLNVEECTQINELN